MFAFFLIMFVGVKSAKIPTLVNGNEKNQTQDVSQLFNQAIENNTCGVISIGANTKLHNISGIVLAKTQKNESIYLAPTKTTDFKSAQQVAKRCHIFWEEKVAENRTFLFSYVPAGKYVLFVKGSSYVGRRRGPPIPKVRNKSDYRINISFHGGNSLYMLTAFELLEN